MISVLDIKKSIDNKLLTCCNCKIYSDEVVQKIIKPCFFTRMFIEKQEMVNKNMTYNHYTFIINYFSEEKTQISLIKMLDKLRKTFVTNLQVNDDFLIINNIETEISTEFLTFKFSLKFYDDILTEDEMIKEPTLKELEINMKNEERMM